MGKAKLDTKDAVQSVVELINKIEKLNSSISKIGGTNSKAFTELKNSMNSLKASITSIKGSFTEMNTQLSRNSNITKTNSKRLTTNSTQVNRLGNLIKTNSKNLRQNTAQVHKNTNAYKKSTSAKKKNNTSLVKGVTLGNLYARAIAKIGQLALMAVQSILRLTVKFESLNFAIKKISGTVFEAGRSMIFMMELNRSFGASLLNTTERWLKFRAAAKQSGLALKETKDIFRSMTKASATLGLSTDELRGVYLALEQMLSKGKVTTEELRRQLGERLPGAMGIMAASMGVTIPILDKMLKRGEVLSAEVLPAFAKEMERAYGIESVKKIETLNTKIGTLTGTWQEFVLTLSEGDSALSGVMQWFLDMGTSVITWFIEAIEDGVQRVRRLQAESSVKVSAKIRDKAEKDVLTNNPQLRAEKKITDEIQEQTRLIEIQQKRGEKGLKEIVRLNEVIRKLALERKTLGEKIDDQEFINAGSEIPRLQKDLDKLTNTIRVLDKEGNEVTIGNLNIDSSKPVRRKIDDIKSWLQEVTGFQDAMSGMGIDTSSASDIEIKEWEDKQVAIAETKEEMEQYMEILEKSTLKPLPPPPTTGTKGRKIRFAKEYEDDNKNFILAAQKRQLILQNAIDLENVTLEGAFRNRQLIQDEETQINEWAQEDEKNALKLKLKNERARWDLTLKGFEEGTQKYKAQLEQHTITVTQMTERLEKGLEDIEAKYALKKQVDLLADYDARLSIIKDFYDAKALIINNEFDAEQGGRDARRLKVATGTPAARDLDNENQRAVHEKNQALLDNLIATQVDLLASTILLQDQTGIKDAEAVKGIESIIAALRKQKVEFKTQSELMYTGEDSWQNWAKKAVEVANEIGNAINAMFDRRIELIDRQIEKETEMFDKSLEMAKDDDAEKAIIERNKEKRIQELEKRKKKEQIKAAKFNKALSLATAATSGAIAIINAFRTTPVATVGIPLGIAMSAIVAAQIATIALAPIPAFAEGGEMTYDGKALINDGGNMEYVQRGNDILTAPNKNAVVDLKRGDIIHKDFDNFIDSNKSFFLDNGIFGFGKKEMDEQLISNAIEKGFEKAKINNKVTVLNKMEDSSYKEKMSNWN